MSRGGGSGRGRPHKLPGVVAPSKVKRICGAEGCGVHVVGTELPHHYKARSDFKKLGQLRKMATEAAEEELNCNGQSFEIYVGSILFLKSFISV